MSSSHYMNYYFRRTEFQCDADGCGRIAYYSGPAFHHLCPQHFYLKRERQLKIEIVDRKVQVTLRKPFPLIPDFTPDPFAPKEKAASPYSKERSDGPTLDGWREFGEPKKRTPRLMD